jgi:hypothetical protein
MPSCHTPDPTAAARASACRLSIGGKAEPFLCYMGAMPTQPKSPFTPQECDLISLEMGMRALGK